MSWTKNLESGHRLMIALSIISIGAVCLWFGADLNTSNAKVAVKTVASSDLGGNPPIAGTGTGAIPDGPGVPTACGSPGSPLNISFDASALSGTVSDISIDMNATHTWVGDITATLIAPDTTEHVIYGATGSTTAAGCGSSDDLGGVYTFNNSGTADWWDLGSPYPAGTYQTTSIGGSPSGGAATDFTAAFAGVDASGTWILRVTDGGGGDTGSISAANLTITTGGGGPMANGDTDFDGDGKTDAAITRDQTPITAGARANDGGFSLNDVADADSPFKTSNRRNLPIASPMDTLGGAPAPGTNRVWWLHSSDTGAVTAAALGSQAGDEQIVPADYDGDGKDDLAVFRPEGATAYFHIFNSASSTIDSIEFGLAGDEPGIVGDYDGDGKADPAVYRQPGAAPFGQTTFFYRGSAGGGGITYVPFGDNTIEDLRAVRGDYDGDGKMDFTIHRTNPAAAGSGQYVTLRSSDNGVTYTSYGLNGDLLFPGDFDGDGKADYMKVRIVANAIRWFLLENDGGGTGAGFIPFGTIALTGFSEFAAPGDYDGDGIDDIAIYRRDNTDGTNCFYYVLRSSDGAVDTFEWGSTADTPVQVWDQQF